MTTAVVVSLAPDLAESLASVMSETRQLLEKFSSRAVHVNSGEYSIANVGSLKPGRKTMSTTLRIGGAPPELTRALDNVEDRAGPLAFKLAVRAESGSK
jgi:hypothetical protein